MDLQIASHKNQCCSKSLPPLPHNYVYREIEPLALPAIVDLTAPTNIKPNGLGCDLPEDPNILPVFELPGCD
jgi:hypothetical protein